MQLTAAIVGPAHGLRGDVYLDVRTDDPDRLAPGSELDTDSPTYPRLLITSARAHKGRLLVTFDAIESREDAEELRGIALLVDESDEDDAWYPHQLEGLRAIDPRGATIGTVVGLRPGAAQDLLLIKHEAGTTPVPFVEALVPVIDLDAGTVTVDAPPGLLDDPDLTGGRTR